MKDPKDTPQYKWQKGILTQMCDNLEKSSKVPYVTTPERSVEEIVREAKERNVLADDPYQDREKWLTQTLQTERQKREEAYYAGLEKAVEVVENRKKLNGDIHDFSGEVAYELDKIIEALTQPNNPD